MSINIDENQVRACCTALQDFLRSHEDRWGDHNMMLACVIISADIGAFHAREGRCDAREMLDAISNQLLITFVQMLGRDDGEVRH